MPTLRNWDTLAGENPIHAAIAAGDEAGEREKGAEVIDILTKQLSAGSVLDVGCGYGRIAKYLLPVRTFEKYIGLDGSVVMLGHFRHLYETGLKNLGTPVELIHSPITAIPLADQSIDNVVVSAVFLHNNKADVRRSMAEIFRVLKPGGKLFVFASFPNKMNGQGLQGSIYLGILALLGQGKRNGPVRYFWKKEIMALTSPFSHVQIIPKGFVTVPKRILLLPGALNRIYQSSVYPKLHALCSHLVSPRHRPTFCAHFDVIAVK